MADAKISSPAAETANLLHRHAAILTRRLRVTHSPAGLGLSKLGILARLHYEGPATASVLAEHLGLQPQSLTRLLSALAAARLVSRHPDKTDGRQNLIVLTAAGEKSLSEIMAQRRDRLGRAISQVLTPAETEILRVASGLMERVAAAIDTSAHPNESVARAK